MTIPEGVTSIGANAFYECSGLTALHIPQSVTNIGIYTINKCYNLTGLFVAEGNPIYHSWGNCIIVTRTKTLVVGCKGSVIPDDGSVTAIGDWAFYDCSSLEKLTLGSSVETIGAEAFDGADNLREIVSNNPVPPSFPTGFPAEVVQNAKVTVPEGSENAYNANGSWAPMVEGEDTGIETVISDDIDDSQPFDIYTLQGIRIGTRLTSVSALAPGIYLLRQGSKVSKIAIR